MTGNDYDYALAGLYAAFDAPRPRLILGCPCCIDTRNVDVLLSKPLGLLTGDDLSRYASGVFLTVGGPVDYRYLLPRIFELSATDLAWYPCPEIVIGALSRAEWGAWSAAERKAVLSFLSAWFDRWARGEVRDDPYGGEIESVLCGLARAGVDLNSYLERLLSLENAASLVELVDQHGRAHGSRPTPEGFWEDAPTGWAQLTGFLSSEPVRLRLLEA
jgi:hypothetical protein